MRRCLCLVLLGALSSVAALFSCASTPTSTVTADAGGDVAVVETHQTMRVDVSAIDHRFRTRDHFIASVEMQISGEPLAEAMGRKLAGFSRDFVCRQAVCSPNIYYDPLLNNGVAGGKNGRVDVVGFASAVESYEYSKQPMNNIALESGAGTALMFGPVLNPMNKTGADALALLRAWVQRAETNANTAARIDATPSPTNPLGWAGLWPTLQPFESWDPTIHPSNTSNGCTISSDDDPGATGALRCDDYECDYTTLHLADREAQVDKHIGPGASGWVDWKQALWVLNYLQVMHDTNEAPVATVPPADLQSVGAPQNSVLATGGGGAPGVYLGSSNIEGFQAAMFLQIADNQAEQWLSALSTHDGASLGGFKSVADALAYNEASNLRWFPASIGVNEAPDSSGFPQPIKVEVASPDSHLLDLAGLLGAFASVYALTDQNNSVVGGSQPALAYFDGEPFPIQNQVPNGSPTLHDRSLAMMRVLVMNIARMHFDPATKRLTDDVALANGQIARGHTLSAIDAAYTLFALRTARRSLDGLLQLYSNTKPDPHNVPTPLDGFPVATGTFGTLIDGLIESLSESLFELTTADGVAFASWDSATGKVTDDGTSLDAHSAAVRGLLTAYLATGKPKYRDRARAVYDRIERAFYDPSARIYHTKANDSGTVIEFTTLRFALLQSALRDTYELIALLPGNGALATTLEARIGRLDKLVLNGWDDRDEDQVVTWPGECAQQGKDANGHPMGLGGLQMGERVLSGESGSAFDTWGGDAGQRIVTIDREHDCVPEISVVKLPAALASSITFTLSPWSGK